MKMITARKINTSYCGQKITIPQGTPVTLVKDADGIKGDLYAIRNIQTLIELTGNTHDPKYRYCFIDHADVIKDPYDYEAFNEGFRIKDLTAFNIPTAIKRIKKNQHLTVYTFKDGSALHVYHTQQWALASMGDRRFNASFTLRTNARGK